ncbi:TIR domain-containing protein [Caballeronia sp. S22]|uniref:TIR domain-containing protein n=1 Tax=Caballeronia sp. S22 TaxID=3137182 RepID=UPI003530C6CA
MKPRVFIGSSVEGLDIAYAVQQNLLHDVEATVWTQGVFDLSDTTIESLTSVLESSDFAVFVFSPDDAVKMRDVTHNAVRDNVLFEFGLFIGKLGRSRVFYIVPSDVDLHIPSDLLGITPGKFPNSRSDNNLQAATGPACNQMRKQIRALGLLNPQMVKPDEPKETASEPAKYAWVTSVINEDYVDADEKIKAAIKEGRPEVEVQGLHEWQCYVEYKRDPSTGIDSIVSLFQARRDDPDKIQLLCRFLLWEGFGGKALELVDTLDDRVKTNPVFKSVLSDCFSAIGDEVSAEAALVPAHGANVDLACQLADKYTENGEHTKAFGVVRTALTSFPHDERLLNKCAHAAMNLNEHRIAAHLFRRITFRHADNADYWGYLGNCCLELNMHDQALTAYRHADKCAGGNASWIQANIGNLLSNSELPTEAISYLKQALVIDEESEYAHDRLARAITGKKEREKALDTACAEGRKLLRDWKDSGDGGSAAVTGLLSGLTFPINM